MPYCHQFFGSLPPHTISLACQVLARKKLDRQVLCLAIYLEGTVLLYLEFIYLYECKINVTSELPVILWTNM